MRHTTGLRRRTDSLDRRDEKRLQIDAVSEISLNGRTSACRIVNISAGGALIESTAIPPLGSHVKLRLPGLGPTAATVARATSTYYALVFITPIDIANLSA